MEAENRPHKYRFCRHTIFGIMRGIRKCLGGTVAGMYFKRLSSADFAKGGKLLIRGTKEAL
jgi:hypothetical protein